MSKILKPLAVIASLALIPTFAMANENTMDKSRPSAVEEAAVTTKIKAEMVKNKTLSAFQIEVDTQDNKVTLSGKVKTALEKAEAERVAHSVKGVSTVKNNIVVDPSI
jgi:hyperosmotically inducible protein